jgi:hypothetical protein
VRKPFGGFTMRRAVLLSLLLALPAIPARADPIFPTIFITGGSLDLAGESKPFGPLVLRGTHNFSANALVKSKAISGLAVSRALQELP